MNKKLTELHRRTVEKLPKIDVEEDPSSTGYWARIAGFPIPDLPPVRTGARFEIVVNPVSHDVRAEFQKAREGWEEANFELTSEADAKDRNISVKSKAIKIGASAGI